MHRKLKNEGGFTLIELLVFILALSIFAAVGVVNIRNVRAQNRDKTSKTDINTMDYYLESFYEKNGYYPQVITTDSLKGIQSDNLKDRNNLPVNAPSSAYVYIPHECVDGKCKRFDLTAELEKEAPFEKQSLNS